MIRQLLAQASQAARSSTLFGLLVLSEVGQFQLRVALRAVLAENARLSSELARAMATIERDIAGRDVDGHEVLS